MVCEDDHIFTMSHLPDGFNERLLLPTFTFEGVKRGR
jgi:hypothetical protein